MLFTFVSIFEKIDENSICVWEICDARPCKPYFKSSWTLAYDFKLDEVNSAMSRAC